MSQQTATTELRNMQIPDLRREARTLRGDIAARRLTLAFGKEKNSGAHRSAKRQLARVLTVIAEKQRETASSTSAS